MYNDFNVQPQMNNTGHGGSDNGEREVATHPMSSNELPPPTQGGVSPVPIEPLHATVHQPVTNDDTSEHWVNEVEQLFVRTVQNPRQRADEFGELRRRYQQDILGLKHKDWEG